MFLISKRVVFENNFFILFIVIESVIGMAFSIISEMPLSYKKGSVYMTGLLIIMYFASAYVIYLLDYDKIDMNFIKLCIKAIFVIQMHWTIVQYILYAVAFFCVTLLIQSVVHKFLLSKGKKNRIQFRCNEGCQ